MYLTLFHQSTLSIHLSTLSSAPSTSILTAVGGRNLAVVGECVDLYSLYYERSAPKCVRGGDSAALLAIGQTGETASFPISESHILITSASLAFNGSVRRSPCGLLESARTERPDRYRDGLDAKSIRIKETAPIRTKSQRLHVGFDMIDNIGHCFEPVRPLE
jgi:hypothetical protein